MLLVSISMIVTLVICHIAIEFCWNIVTMQFLLLLTGHQCIRKFFGFSQTLPSSTLPVLDIGFILTSHMSF